MIKRLPIYQKKRRISWELWIYMIKNLYILISLKLMVKLVPIVTLKSLGDPNEKHIWIWIGPKNI